MKKYIALALIITCMLVAITALQTKNKASAHFPQLCVACGTNCLCINCDCDNNLGGGGGGPITLRCGTCGLPWTSCVCLPQQRICFVCGLNIAFCTCEPLIIQPPCTECGARCRCLPCECDSNTGGGGTGTEPGSYEELIKAVKDLAEQQEQQTQRVEMMISIAIGTIVGLAFMNKWQPGV